MEAVIWPRPLVWSRLQPIEEDTASLVNITVNKEFFLNFSQKWKIKDNPPKINNCFLLLTSYLVLLLIIHHLRVAELREFGSMVSGKLGKTGNLGKMDKLDKTWKSVKRINMVIQVNWAEQVTQIRLFQQVKQEKKGIKEVNWVS